MERGVNTHLTGNGAPIIHDFEMVFQGHTNVLAGMPYIILLAGDIFYQVDCVFWVEIFP